MDGMNCGSLKAGNYHSAEGTKQTRSHAMRTGLRVGRIRLIEQNDAPGGSGDTFEPTGRMGQHVNQGFGRDRLAWYDASNFAKSAGAMHDILRKGPPEPREARNNRYHVYKGRNCRFVLVRRFQGFLTGAVCLDQESPTARPTFVV